MFLYESRETIQKNPTLNIISQGKMVGVGR